MTSVAILGAGGNMGRRITRGLQAVDDGSYDLRLVEAAETSLEKIRAESNEALIFPEGQALHDADVVIFAVPDRIVRDVAPGILAQLRDGAALLFLDTAAVAAGRIPVDERLACFVVHPTHPPLYSLLSEENPEARKDYWGGGLARQALVFAHAWGPTQDDARVEQVARDMFAPITESHRISVHQMALLEPALTETLANGCVAIIREGLEQVIALGVPAPAATDFLSGHLQIGIALIFDKLDWKLSEGAQLSLEQSRRQLFKDDWADIFDEANLMRSLQQITGGAD